MLAVSFVSLILIKHEMASSSSTLSTNKTAEVDINEVFDNILFSEEHYSEEGFKEGYNKGLIDGEEDGHHLGYHRGAELGAELGYYKGVFEACLALNKNKPARCLPEKTVAVLTKVLDLIEQFPNTNSSDIDIIELRDNIRARYKKGCSLMKIDSNYPESTKLSF